LAEPIGSSGETVVIDLPLAKSVLDALEKRGLTLGSAESLTGGLFASTVCAVPSASKVFLGSIVSYANSVKTGLLDVKNETIGSFGVVSQNVADEMASGGRASLHVDVCVSFTGNAGPTSEPGDAPVGRVYMTVALPDGFLRMQKNYQGSRNEIRERCVEDALRAIEKKFA
jgi:PncC family amidohydrolase